MIPIFGLTIGKAISLALYLIYLLVAIVASIKIISRKSDPVKSLSWITVMIFLPYIGIILYLMFGQNYRKSKIYSRKGNRDERFRKAISSYQIKLFNKNTKSLPPALHRFKKMIYLNLMGNNSVLGLNSDIQLFFSGKNALDAMYLAISNAKRDIHLQSYIIEEDLIGKQFIDLLVEKAAQGVEVRIMYDSVGCWKLNRKTKKRMKKAGIEVLEFAPVRFPGPTSMINYRNHRKILITDDEVGFIGGVNIADRYYNGGDFPEWRDTHMMLRGESVSAMQSSFLLDRYFIVRKQLRRQYRKFSTLNRDAINKVDNTKYNYYTQIITSGPDSDWASIMQCYFEAITSATHHIYIVTPYFIPNESILNAIKIAALGGIDVRLMIPEKSDAILAFWSTMSYATELMDAGVKVYLFSDGFNHSKVISIDGEFCLVGSANFDNRSFEHNFEITSIIYNREVASSIENRFNKDISRCKLLAASKWAKRGIKNKSKEAIARLFSPLF